MHGPPKKRVAGRMALAVATAVLAVLWGAAPLVAQQFELTDAQFNRWLTNGRSSPIQFVEMQLNGQLAELDRACHLTDLQRQKLELAGRGDLARLQAEITALHAELVGKSYDQNEIGNVHSRIQPLGERVRKGILDEESLFQKVKASTLDEQQRTAYDKSVAERTKFQFEAKLKLFVAALDAKAPMLAKQREALLALLIAKSQPPRQWGNEQYEWLYVVYQASRMPADELKGILDDAQVRCFQDAVSQGPQYGQMLKQQGMLPEGEANQPAAPRQGGAAAQILRLAIPFAQ